MHHRLPSMPFALLVMLGAVVVLGIGGLVTTWDGAWFAARVLETGTPTFLHGRLVGWATQAPALLVRSLGGDADGVTTALGIGMAAGPAVALLACWRICAPDRRQLMVWPILGIGLASLPGQAMVVWEAGLAVALGWPVILAAALGRLRRHRLLVGLLIGALLVTHPFAVPVLGFAALAAAVHAARDRLAGTPSRSTAWALLAALAGALAIRYLLIPSSYEADTLSLDRIASQFRGAVLGRPLVGITLTWALGAWLLVRPRADRLGLAVIGTGTVALLLVLIPWAADPARWAQALGFRTFVLAAHLPLMAAAVMAARRPDDVPAHAANRSLAAPMALGAASVALVVLSSQTLAWQNARSDTVERLSTLPAGCVSAVDAEIDGSLLDHWGVTALVYLEQAPAPRHLVVVDASCTALDVVGGVPFKIVEGVLIERVPVDGAFDLRAIDAAMRGRSP